MSADEQRAATNAAEHAADNCSVHDNLLSAADPALTEDQALALLKQADLPAQALGQLAKNGALLQLRKVKVALVCHPHTPRHLSIPLARQFYTFDLMRVALAPAVPADVKVAAEAHCHRWPTIRRALQRLWINSIHICG